MHFMVDYQYIFSFEENYELILDRLNSFRLVNKNHFVIEEINRNTISEKILKLKNDNARKGLLLLYDCSLDTDDFNFDKILSDITKVAIKLGMKWRSLAIDSINSLQFHHANNSSNHLEDCAERLNLNDIIGCIKKNKFLGIILNEKGDHRFKMLPYLCDVAVKLGHNSNGRHIEIVKARNQNFQSGKHPFRISDGTGFIVYPSLSAVLSTLRHKVKATRSEEKYIPLPKAISKELDLKKIIEKTLTLIEGPAVGGKTVFLLDMITSDTEYTPKKIIDVQNNVFNNKQLIAPKKYFNCHF